MTLRAGRVGPDQFGPTLQKLRDERGMTRAELSAGSGLSRRKIAKFERGRGSISDGDRRALAAALDVEPEELIPPIPEPERDADAGIDTDTDGAATPDDAITAESVDAPVSLDDVDPASEPESVEAPVADTSVVAGDADTTDPTDAVDVAPEPAAVPVATAAEVGATDETTDVPDTVDTADTATEHGTLPGVAPDALLREYLSMLLELRDTQRISPTSLRQEDLSELATALGGTPEAIEARLMELLGTDEQEAWQLRTTILPSLGATSSRR